MTKKSPESNLRPAGRSLWTAITGSYDLHEHELAVLLEAGRTVDLLADLEDEIRTGGAIVEGPTGQRVNPAAVEARQQRIVLGRLLSVLRIPDDSGSGQRKPTRPMRGVHRLPGA